MRDKQADGLRDKQVATLTFFFFVWQEELSHMSFSIASQSVKLSMMTIELILVLERNKVFLYKSG